MKTPNHMLRLKGFRYPLEIITYAVWACHRFALSTADVEDLLAERGVIVSRDAIRLWINRFGRHFANCIRRDRPRPNDKWHLDDVVITIRGNQNGAQPRWHGTSQYDAAGRLLQFGSDITNITYDLWGHPL